ncbi:MAG: flagellin [SAR324 cluster bacterium]|nr:flagellin [SAR324 cluster bacterium]
MGSLVINHNSQAINTHRNLLNTDRAMKKTLEHLSSGERIVRAADGPAQLMISEQMRAQIASVNQAIENAQTGVSMIQTTEAALDEVNKLLVSVRQRAIHAANEGANDMNMLEADQFEIRNALESIDRIAQFSQFGKKKLLDGSNGVNGLAAGAGLTFMRASTDTKASSAAGYEVTIRQVATKASFTTSETLTTELIDSEVTISVEEEGRVASLVTKKGEDVMVISRKLQNALNLDGLRINVSVTEDGRMTLTHRDFGTDSSFSVVSDRAGFVGETTDIPTHVNNGLNVSGTISGQLATGEGRILTASVGTDADGLQVAYDGPVPPDPEKAVGRVKVSQNSLMFQVGPDAGQKVMVALNSVTSRTIALNVDNQSGFKNLSQVDVLTAQGAEDTMRLVSKAIDDITVVRGGLGAIQKNAMESNIRSLQVSREELINAESIIRDADMAAETSEFVRNKVLLSSGMAMLGQANQTTQNVLNLIQSA